jgi:hypothetical protein
LGSANFRTRQRREKEAFRYEWDVGERGYYSSLHSSQVRTKKNGMGRKVMKSERNVRFFNRRFEGEWMVEKTIKFSSLTQMYVISFSKRKLRSRSISALSSFHSFTLNFLL